MGIVTAHAVGLLKGLALVGFLQVGALYVMAIQAQRRRRLGEMEVELHLADLTRLVGGVAGIATHVESGVPAAFLGHIHADLVAAQAEILLLVSRFCLQELILIIRGVRIVTLQTVANRRRMNRTLEVGGIFVGVAGQAERDRGGGDQLYSRDVFVDANLVASGTAHGDRRMHRLAFGVVLMAGDA